VVAKRKLVSMREYARRRGVTTEAVSKAVKTGRISLVGKKVDVAAADRDWSANTQPGQMAAKKTRKAPSKATRRTQTAPEAQPAAGDSTVNNYATARARREDYLARMAQTDFEERAGQLVNANEIKAEWIKLITEAKTRLLSVPIKCKSRIPGLSALDVSIIESLIRDELEELVNANG
jgi:phage terminase Nu1 subunit (DNA packaging protein)